MENMGGNGLIARYTGASSGKTILIRCDMDAVPVHENSNLSYGSCSAGVSHACGHDGHMAIVAGVAESLKKLPLLKGTVLLLFQPAEETGRGAEAVLKDMALKQVSPDMVFGFHNLPGFHLNSVVTSFGPFASASTGLRLEFTGREAHAAEPQNGNSPVPMLAELIPALNSTGSRDHGNFITVTHLNSGKPSFGISPGKATVMATLRAPDDSALKQMLVITEDTVTALCRKHRIKFQSFQEEPFPATVNDKACSEAVRKAAGLTGLNCQSLTSPFLWSEDFGHFTSQFRGAMFGLGAGTDCPALHSGNYDFPEQMIKPAIELIRELMNIVL